MSHQWDELSKSLAEESLPRRESLRLLGAALAGALLSPLGFQSAWARGPDPCKTVCKCRNKQQQNDCLAACRACNSDPSRTSRLFGTCGSYACCGNGQAYCGGYCADLGNDVYNCGGCGALCQWLPNTIARCLDGACYYTCQQGFHNCNGDPDDGCETDLMFDPNNCGACGYVCNEATPYCNQGTCSQCPPGWANCYGSCISLAYDNANCGDCGNVCPSGTVCYWGACESLNCGPDDPDYPNC